MTDLTLYSKHLKVLKRIKRTTAKGWKDIKPGDSIYMSLDVKPNGRGSNGGCYQSYIDVRVEHTNGTVDNFFVSLNRVNGFLDKFEIC